jgi:hypothetical protein
MRCSHITASHDLPLSSKPTDLCSSDNCSPLRRILPVPTRMDRQRRHPVHRYLPRGLRRPRRLMRFKVGWHAELMISSYGGSLFLCRGNVPLCNSYG